MASSILKWVVSHQNCSRSKDRSGREEAGDSDLNHKTGECGPRPNLAGQTVSGGSVGCVWLAMGCGSTLTPTLLQGVPWKRVTGNGVLCAVGRLGLTVSGLQAPNKVFVAVFVVLLTLLKQLPGTDLGLVLCVWEVIDYRFNLFN